MNQKDIEAFYQSLEERRIVLDKLKEIQDTVGLSKEDRMRYEASLKVYRDQLAMLEYARQQGRAEGLAKAKACLEIARNMKAAGIAPELIAQITRLDFETIERL